jgi:predicted  nucleic acid-binding Zn-ribbon protein
MGLFQRLKHDLKAGLATLRLGTAQVANRALEETELLRIRLEIRKLDQQLDELNRDVGERAVNLREGGEPVERVLYDAEIGRLVKEIQELKDARGKLESEMADVRADL